VVAAKLGTINLSGVNQMTSNALTFGVAFRQSVANAKGTVAIGNVLGTLIPPFSTLGQFRYLGLNG